MYDPGKGFIYQDLPPTTMLNYINDFDYVLKRCCEFWELDYDAIEYTIPLIAQIYKRINQREDYYLYFHSKPDDPRKMSQSKHTALLAFWVLKYKPLSMPGINEDLYVKYGTSINELFAIYIIQAFSVEVSPRKDIKDYFNQRTIENIVYNFMHRDFSKEAMIFYVNSLLNIVEK